MAAGEFLESSGDHGQHGLCSLLLHARTLERGLELFCWKRIRQCAVACLGERERRSQWGVCVRERDGLSDRYHASCKLLGRRSVQGRWFRCSGADDFNTAGEPDGGGEPVGHLLGIGWRFGPAELPVAEKW